MTFTGLKKKKFLNSTKTSIQLFDTQVQVFLSNLDNINKKSLDYFVFILAQFKQHIEHLFFPNQKNFQKFCSILKKCKESMDICVYQLTHSTIIEILIDLANKGKLIRIIMDSKSEDEEKKKILVTKLLVLSGFKIQVCLHENKGLMHSKFCLIDLRKIVLGSANWTYQAFSLNTEHISILRDETSSKLYRDFFHKIWNQANLAQFSESKILYINNAQEKKLKKKKKISFLQRKREKEEKKLIQQTFQQDIIKELNFFQEFCNIKVMDGLKQQNPILKEEKKQPEEQQNPEDQPKSQLNEEENQWNKIHSMYQPFFVKKQSRLNKRDQSLNQRIKKDVLIVVDDKDDIEIQFDDLDISS